MQTNSGGFQPPTPAEVVFADQEPDDPRLEHFRRFLKAVNEKDYKSGIAATQALRAKGISVVLTSPHIRGTRHGA